jgi:hypothetical protein
MRPFQSFFFRHNHSFLFRFAKWFRQAVRQQNLFNAENSSLLSRKSDPAASALQWGNEPNQHCHFALSKFLVHGISQSPH